MEVFTAGAGAATQTAALKALFANDPLVTIVSDVAQANAALVWLYPSGAGTGSGSQHRSGDRHRHQRRSEFSRSKQPCRQSWRSTSPNPWPINAVEPAAAAVIGTFDVKAQAVIDLVRGRFLPSGKLPVSVPASNAAVQANASDVPGYAESFDYVYRNAVNDRYVFGFGLSDF